MLWSIGMPDLKQMQILKEINNTLGSITFKKD